MLHFEFAFWIRNTQLYHKLTVPPIGLGTLFGFAYY